MRVISRSASETKNIAAKLARSISKNGFAKQGRAIVVALEGELGAGKTTFVQGFVRALGIKEKVKSPTFLLIKSYKLKVKSFSHLYHIDCYRINTWKELEPLEIRDILKDPSHIVLVEWPERIRPILPKKRVNIHIDHISKNERKITTRK